MIKRYAFGGTNLVKCTYFGSKKEWDAIKIDSNNESLLSCEIVYVENNSDQEIN